MRFFLRIALLLISFVSPANAWWNGGHMIAAEVAHRYLTPETRCECEGLLSLLDEFFPDSSNFVTASIWADQLRDGGLDAFNSWHYVVQPYDPEGILSQEQRIQIEKTGENANAAWAIEQAVKTLSNPNAIPFGKALMLRFLIHLVADIHMPLHVTTLYSHQFPAGDRGGNLYIIRSPIAPNLHLLWDAGVGAFPLVDSPSTPVQRQNARRYAKQSIDRYPPNSLAGTKNLDVQDWLREGFDIAKDHAYKTKRFMVPSHEYIAEGQEICQRRIVLAGYRLANLLNSIFQESQELN
ncbi:MAG: S1/P1 nuclease [Chlamydiales bacterium]|nr:S1/P1 nuclease [Chlamydiales bacterium]